MLPQDLVRTAWESLWAHRLRTVLSVLGIVIGIGSFSLMYSVGETARQKTLAAIQALGGDIFRVMPLGKDEDSQNSPEQVSFSLKDVAAIKKACPSVLAVSPQMGASVDYFVAGRLISRQVDAVLPAYFEMNKIQVRRGRLFTDIDTDYDLQVCLLGYEAAKEIFPDKDPLGQNIPINGYLFRVTGILKEIELSTLRGLNENIIIPLPIAQRLFPEKKVIMLHLRGKNTQTAMGEIKQFLFRRFGDKAGFNVQSQRLLLKAQQQSLRIFEYVMWAIGGISLVVGGIGIMNIMLVSVTERVREIGIRRAVGATRMAIKLQFLCEAMLLCVLGGVGGTALGFAGSEFISRSFGFQPIFSIRILLVAIMVASVLGLICGTYPAVRAANQDPTVVLRYE